jgi:hypothetical protein
MKNSIKSIYLSNILEGYYKSYNALKLRSERNFWTRYDILDGNRALFYGDDDKVVVTSTPINKTHFAHINTLMKWTNVHNISPAKATHSICEDCMRDKNLLKKLMQIITNNPGIALIPYRTTPQFQRLILFLREKKLKFETPEMIPDHKQFVLNYFNNKRGFRHLWHLSEANNPPFIQIPEGFITQNKKEAIDAAWWFKQQDKSFVIKYNSGVQGIGVEIIDHQTLPHNKEKFYHHFKKLLSDKMWSEPIIIVEQAIAPNEKNKSISPSIEIYINPEGKVTSSYACDQILAPDKRTYRGIYLYPELTIDPAIQKTFSAGVRFGKKLAEYGYRGVFDIDLMRGPHNRMYAVEANLRRNGGTHLHELCVALLGGGYTRSFHALIEDVILQKKHNLTYEKCCKLFVDCIYTPKKQSGIIIANPDMLQVNILAIVVIGKTRDQIKALRKKIDTILDGTITEKLESRDW